MTECRRPDCDRPTRSRGYCEKHYRYMVHTGRFGYADATPARRHVRKLRSLGWTYEQIADAAGTSAWTPNQLARGKLGWLWPDTSQAILTIDAKPVDSHRGVCPIGTFAHVPGPSRQAATKARRRGYAPPLAWDDPDDLRERPKEVAA